MPDQWLRLSEIARRLSLSERTVQRFVTDSQHPLPVHRFGRAVRVRESDYEQWLREHTHATTRGTGKPPSYWVRRAAAGLLDVPFDDDEEKAIQ